jgi:hypothetical protein
MSRSKLRNGLVLESVVDCTWIHNCPANTSPTKQLYSFSRTPRFPARKSYCDKIYELAGDLRKGGAGIGYGTKSNFTKDMAQSPAPGKYVRPSFVELNAARARGFTLGLGRDRSPQRGHIKLDPLKNPGVGSYDVRGSFSKTIRSNERFSMGGKVPDPSADLTRQPNPQQAQQQPRPRSLRQPRDLHGQRQVDVLKVHKLRADCLRPSLVPAFPCTQRALPRPCGLPPRAQPTQRFRQIHALH